MCSMGADDTTDFVRRRGFQWPPNRLQIFDVFVVLLSVLLFAAGCIPLITTPLRHIVGISYGTSLIALICSAGYVSWCDPSVKEEPLTDEAWTALTTKPPCCGICKTEKKWRTEHCNFCDRCVSNFDHHCIWLNNCVGGANYPAFALTLFNVLVMTSIIVGTCIGLVVGFVDGSIEDDDSPEVIFGIISIGFLMLINFPLLILDVNLITYHLGIWWKSMTTMEYLRACNAHDKQTMLHWSTGAPMPLQDADGKRPFSPFPMFVDWVIFRRRIKKPKAPKPGSLSKVAASPAPADDTVAVAQQALREAAAAAQTPCEISVPAQAAPADTNPEMTLRVAAGTPQQEASASVAPAAPLALSPALCATSLPAASAELVALAAPDYADTLTAPSIAADLLVPEEAADTAPLREVSVPEVPALAPLSEPASRQAATVPAAPVQEATPPAA